MTLVLLSNIAATLAMTGIVWFVQVVHYPLYKHINPDAFPQYEVAHVNMVTPVVGPIMILEAGTTLLMLVSPPDYTPYWLLLIALGLIGVIWAVTLIVTVPQHNTLLFEFNAEAHQALVHVNWLRTAAWTTRSLIMLWILSRLLP